LKKLLGNWDASVSTTMPADCDNWTAKASYRAAAKRGSWSDFNGVMNGMPYIATGRRLMTRTRKIVSTWVDSMGTELMLMEGTHDASKNSTSVSGETHDKVTGKLVKHRMVTEMKDNDSMTLRMYVPGVDARKWRR